MCAALSALPSIFSYIRCQKIVLASGSNVKKPSALASKSPTDAPDASTSFNPVAWMSIVTGNADTEPMANRLATPAMTKLWRLQQPIRTSFIRVPPAASTPAAMNVTARPCHSMIPAWPLLSVQELPAASKISPESSHTRRVVDTFAVGWETRAQAGASHRRLVRQLMRHLPRRRGSTLLELLVMGMIIALLAALLIPMFLSAQDRAIQAR